MKKSTKKKPKTKAFDLVAGTVKSSSTGTKWTELLCPEELTYVHSVVSAMAKMPGAAHYVVAKKLKEELQLDIHVATIARTLKELATDA